MDDWNKTHHKASGLWDASLTSTIHLENAENACLEFAKRHVKEGESPLCGNTVWQDRRFLFEHMPKLEKHFHYRVIDTSTIKELYQRWYPDQPLFKKREAHRALDDILESIEELAFYMQNEFLRAPKTVK
jgi:oligoribonuclease